MTAANTRHGYESEYGYTGDEQSGGDGGRYAHEAGPRLSRSERDAIVRRLQMVAEMMDNQFVIPGTDVRFGIDALIGLVPVAGDFIGVGVSAYIIFEAKRLGASPWTLLRMVVNVLIDFFAGSVPVIGDLFDVAFKSHTRNLELLGIRPRHRG